VGFEPHQRRQLEAYEIRLHGLHHFTHHRPVALAGGFMQSAIA